MTMPNSCLSSVTERPRCSRRSSARRRCIGRLARGTSASGTLGTSRIRLGIQQTMKCGSRNSVTTCAGEPHARIDGRRRKPAPFGTSRAAPRYAPSAHPTNPRVAPWPLPAKQSVSTRTAGLLLPPDLRRAVCAVGRPLLSSRRLTAPRLHWRRSDGPVRPDPRWRGRSESPNY